MAPLSKETMTARALISKLLVRATKKWPTDKALNRSLSELYGAYVNSFVSKYKDKHVITVTLEIVNERYLNDKTPLLQRGMALLNEIIWNPLVNDGAFDTYFVNQETTLLRKKLEAMVDNKSQTAYVNLLTHMFGTHPYRYLSMGSLDELKHITAESLYDAYKSMIEQDYCSVYVVGNVDETETHNMIDETFNVKPFTYADSGIPFTYDTAALPKTIVDYDVVDQAKLNLGYRLPTHYGHKDYYALVVLNMMFGGDPSSVLFSEVREKQSLAYSIHSQIDAKNGFLFVLSGVSVDQYEKAKDTVIASFDTFRTGDFTDEKLALAKKVILSQRKESADKPKNIIEILHNQLLLDDEQKRVSFETQISKVTREDIIQLAQQAVLDTVYILTKEEGAVE